MIRVFGIRHHGPGCARSLLAALNEWQPDVIALEAPGDIESRFEYASYETMKPPVAMLIYPQDQPAAAVVYPLAVFSPEWQALRWAAVHKVPVRAMDLPMALRFPHDQEKLRQAMESSAEESQSRPSWRADPIAILAEAAGYQDHELWWEEQIERRQDAHGVFDAIQEAMTAVRDEFPESSETDLLREAYMRKTIRATLKEGFQKIAVICGAWHGPFVDELAVAGKRPGCKTTEDNARLKGQPKIKTTATWIPWTHSRLAYRSGYGAGIHAPGWYAHLWESEADAPTRWFVNAARLLRERDLGASSASVIEARRLADTLASLRELRTPGLNELNESILAVMCQGEETPLRAIRNQLELGERLGSVPPETPSVPLEADVQRLQKSLRLKISLTPKLLDLDLRNDHAREQSRTLHRLVILGIPWGQLQSSGSATSTFHEVWKLEWKPEFAISIIEANVWGSTLLDASSARILNRAETAPHLSDITQLFHDAMQADLNSVFPILIERIQSASAISADVIQLMDALGPLASVIRYGDVRGTDTTQLKPIVSGMFARVCVGLFTACTGVNDELATTLVQSMSKTQDALDLLQQAELQDEWNLRIQRLAFEDFHGLLSGSATRNLLERQLLDAAGLETLTRKALGPAQEIAYCAHWISGLFGGSSMLLIHQDSVWQVLDFWLLHLEESLFLEMLPVLRRSFAKFSVAERRVMAAKLKSMHRHSDSADRNVPRQGTPLHYERAAKVLPILAKILGGQHAAE
ncbi:DUF5682 family protein [Planctomicrobium sp. SH668]|uniref:DUF5682 family protein n=1 Tax=Planctomicrobium sp. SH668 TaxID=3448126 RepID=UPI003F5BB50F